GRPRIGPMDPAKRRRREQRLRSREAGLAERKKSLPPSLVMAGEPTRRWPDEVAERASGRDGTGPLWLACLRAMFVGSTVLRVGLERGGGRSCWGGGAPGRCGRSCVGACARLCLSSARQRRLRPQICQKEPPRLLSPHRQWRCCQGRTCSCPTR